MRWNLCVYGDTYFKQLIGAAMVHHHPLFLAQENMLIPKYNGHSQMPLMVCYIDDTSAIHNSYWREFGFILEELNEFKNDITWQVCNS